MGLDSNLFTLQVQQNGELVELENGVATTTLYARAPGDKGAADLHILDGLTSSCLSSIKSLSNKLRLVTLYSPDATVEFKNKSIVHWEWSFEFEDHKYFFRRDREFGTGSSSYYLWLSRKPDPDWNMLIYRPNKRLAPATIQLLDYNISRLEFQDRKGWEVVALTTLFSFVDRDNGIIDDNNDSSVPVIQTPEQSSSNGPPPPIAKTPSPKLESLAPNDIVITSSLENSDYVDHCVAMFQDESLMFITIRGQTPEAVPRAVAIAADIKRARYRQSGEDLQTNIDYDERISDTAMAGRRPSFSGANPKAPPASIKVFLSRIPLEELMPRPKMRAPQLPPKQSLSPKPNGNSGRTGFFRNRGD